MALSERAKNALRAALAHGPGTPEYDEVVSAIESVSGGTITMDDGANIVTGTTTGTKIGTAAAQKIGFYGATPVAQRASAAQAAVDTTPATDSSPYGFTENQANAIVALLNEIRTVLVNVGLMKGSA